MSGKSNKYSPTEKLIDLIDTYWSFENTTAEDINLPVVPDGCMDIIYKRTSDKLNIILVGAMDKMITVSIKPNDYYFGIRFKPAVLSFLLDREVDDLINKIINLQEVSPKFFKKFYVDSIEHLDGNKINKLLENELLNGNIDMRIVECAAMITKSVGDIPIKDLESLFGLSQRQLERLFKFHVGFSPKKFSRIIRFYHAHNQLVEKGTKDLISTAYELGYYDQAHFNRDYKNFTLVTPKNKIMSVLYNTEDS